MDIGESAEYKCLILGRKKQLLDDRSRYNGKVVEDNICRVRRVICCHFAMFKFMGAY